MSYVLRDSSTIEFACAQKGTVEKNILPNVMVVSRFCK